MLQVKSDYYLKFSMTNLIFTVIKTFKRLLIVLNAYFSFYKSK